MADPIQKFLAKLAAKERKLIYGIIKKILSNDLVTLQVKKLTGSKDIFRVRKGDFRIIYQKKEKDYKIISIDRRSESTYKDF
jgi:mRNA-degrading endonuclease RelE of RelBE toxin-antitoxin system